jgi:hypothetical protein
MNGMKRSGIGLLLVLGALLAAGAAAQAARTVAVAIAPSQLEQQLLPADRRHALCSGDCAIGREAEVRDLRIALRRPQVVVSGRLAASGIPWIGDASSNLSCAVTPVLQDQAEVVLRDVRCTAGNLVLAPLALLAGQLLERGEPVDLRERARRGELGRHSDDPALSAPRARSCVDRITAVEVRDDDVRVAVGVTCPR